MLFSNNIILVDKTEENKSWSHEDSNYVDVRQSTQSVTLAQMR